MESRVQPSAPPATSHSFIIGAPKCGTTTLFRALETHPEVACSQVKEPHHFGADLETTPSRRVLDREAYLDLFDDTPEARTRCEASVMTLYSESAPEEIQGFDDEARLIVMLRDPISFVHSMHWQSVSTGHEDLLDIREALEAEPDRANGDRIPSGCLAPLHLRYTFLSDFAPHIARYRRAFGAERIHIVTMDEWKANAPAAFQRVLRFLEVDDRHPLAVGRVNAARKFQRNVFRRVLFRHPALARTYGKLPATHRRRLGRVVSLLNPNPTLRRPELPPDVRKDLSRRLRPNVQRLEDLLGRRFPDWASPETR